MADQKLIDQVKKFSEGGLDRGAVTNMLQVQGWQSGEIDEAFSLVTIPPPPPPPPTPVPQAPVVSAPATIATPISSPAPIPIPMPPAFIPEKIATPVAPVATTNPVPSAEVPKQFTPPVAPTNFPGQRRPMKMASLLIIVVILILVAGGGVYAYFKLTSTNISPKDIFGRSVKAMMDVKSFSFVSTSTGVVGNKIGNGVPSLVDFTFTSNGAVDFHSLDNLLLDLKYLNMSVKADSATSSGSLDLGLGVKFAHKDIYLVLNNFNLVYNSTDPSAMGAQMAVGMINGVIAPLKNKWILIDLSKDTATSTIQNQQLFTDEDLARIKDYITGLSYLDSINQVGSETINGAATYHLKATVQAGQSFVDLVKKIGAEKQVGVNMSPNDIADYNKGIDSLTEMANKKLNVDFWVGQKDFMIYKVETGPIAFSDAQSGAEATTSLEEILGDYNKPVIVTTPQGAVPIEQLMQNMFGSLYTPATSTPKTPTLKAK